MYVHASMRYGVIPTKIFKFSNENFICAKISGFTVYYTMIELLAWPNFDFHIVTNQLYI